MGQPLHEAPEFAGHAKQVVAIVAFIAVENVPAAHVVHVKLPDVVLKVPARHAVQFPPFGPVNPGLHMQPVKTVHPLHDAPVLEGHCKQGPPFGP